MNSENALNHICIISVHNKQFRNILALIYLRKMLARNI